MKFDPAGLNDIRDGFTREAGQRWSRTAKELKRAIVVDDVLGIGPKAPHGAQPAADKAALFGRWVDERLMVNVAGRDAGWMGPPLYAASQRAARAQLRDASVFVPSATRSAPICHAASKSSLADICSSASRRVQDAIRWGLEARVGRRGMASLVDRALGDGLKRTRMLGEHAVTQAYSQAVLDELEDRGYTHVGTISERASQPRKFAADGLPVAAGVMFVDPAGRALFLRRTDGEGWAFPGGGVEAGETLENAALREAHEECGGGPTGPMEKLWRSTAHGVDFTTFRQDVQQAFEPQLNEEHDSAVWADPGDPPQPLHPGVAEMLRGHGLIDYDPDEPRDDAGKWTTAYHGSPHDFDHFDLSKIDSGEGSQYYGYGLYFAENKAVGEEYQKNLAGFSVRGKDGELLAHVIGKPMTSSGPDSFDPRYVANRLYRAGFDFDKARSVLNDRLQKRPYIKGDVFTAETDQRALKLLDDWEAAGAHKEEHGFLYQVAVKQSADKFIDYDKPIGEQPALLSMLHKAGFNVPKSVPTKETVAGLKPTTARRLQEVLGSKGSEFIPRDAKEAKRLMDAGIKGVRFLDAGSRDSGDGSRNIVVFDPDDVEITHKNGVAIKRGVGDAETDDRAAYRRRWLELAIKALPGGEHDPARLKAFGVTDFDPDEPRDEIGRWTSGSGRGSVEPAAAGAASAHFVSPSVASHLDFDQAKAEVDGARHQAMVQISGEIDNALHLSGGETRSIIGAWSDGAENSIIATYPNASWDQVKLAAAMKGFVGDQKAVLAFKQDAQGDAILYRFGAQGDLKDIHQRLLSDGLAFHSLAPTAGGADVFVADLDGSAHEGIKKAAEDFGAHVTYERGKAEFLGAAGEAATDRATRDDARGAYARTIDQSPVFGGADAWNRNRDRWVSQLDGAATAAGSSGGDARGGGGSGGEGLRAAQETAAQVAAGQQPLSGLPQKPITFADGSSYVPGPIAKIRDVAAKYMADSGLPYSPPDTYVKVDPARAKSIADAFDAMPNAPDDPAVKASYSALAKETIAQFHALQDAGLKVEWIKDGQADPYAANPRLAAKDVAENNHWWGFPTDMGYGSGDAVDHTNNPMLQKTGDVVDGRAVVVNDLFRAVHDYFGHFKEGVGFRADGEDNAWRSHAAMFSRAALPAMTAETRGQNSWVNFGPYGETNRHASAADTHYAPQKIGVMPDWAFDDISKGRSIKDAIAAWIMDAARATPQTRHPSTGRFAPVPVAMREIHRSKRTGQFRRQGPDPQEQDRAERANRAFAGAEGDLDVLTANDDKVCPVCDRISANGPYTINHARSLIPAHPNCRCMFVAAGSIDLGDAYDPDQPRDDHGRWSTGGAGAGGMQGLAANLLGFGGGAKPAVAHGSGRSIEEIAAAAGLGQAAALAGALKVQTDKRRAQEEKRMASALSSIGSPAARGVDFDIPARWAKGVSLYHGTSSQALAHIEQEGLIPHASAAGDEYAKQQGMGCAKYAMEGGRAVSVYMSDDADLAKEFSKIASKVSHSKPVLLQINIPASEAKRLHRDEQASIDPPAHAVRFEGKIPAAWVKRVPMTTMGMGLGVRLTTDAEAPITIYAVLFVDGDDALADYNPDEPRDDAGKWTALEGSKGHPALISSRNATGVKASKEAAGHYLRIDTEAMKLTPEKFKENMNLFKNGDFYPGVAKGELAGKKPEEIAEIVEQRMVDNLKFLASAEVTSKEDFANWKQWYDGAHKYAEGLSKKGEIDIASASGVIAALSPSNDWDMNVFQANAVVDAMHNKQNAKWDDKMSKVAHSIWRSDDTKPYIPDIEGKTLAEVTDADPQIAAVKKAMWIRTENEAHDETRNFRRMNPDGSFGDFAVNKGDGQKTTSTWKATGAIANAVRSYLSGGDQTVLSNAMGKKHKVRSFFNNILDPHSKNDDVTIDTHAVGAAWLSASTQTDPSVVHNLASSMKISEQPKGWKAAASSGGTTGVTGLYGIYADAYRRAAHELHIEPRELQSITWTQKRLLLSGRATKAAVDAVWRKFNEGGMSLKAAQREVIRVAKANLKKGGDDEADGGAD